jgi:hypothetical protein
MAEKPDPSLAAMIANLGEKTGRTLDQWLALVQKSGCSKHGEIVKWLKAEHGMGHGYANLVAHSHLEAAAGGPASSDDLVQAQYAGEKAALKPILDALLAAVAKFGADVEVAPKKGYVSLRRKKQFALIQPSTKTRIDVGINLKGRKPSGRLEASGSFNAMVSHRVRIESASAIDPELLGWLKEAYLEA